MTVCTRYVRIDPAAMWAGRDDGRTLGVPLAWLPRLTAATPEQRGAVTIAAPDPQNP